MNVSLKESAVAPLSAALVLLNINKTGLHSGSRKKDFVAARILLAWAYYHIGFEVPEIAVKLNISRSMVYRYLKEAEERPKSDKVFALIFNTFKAHTKIF